MSIYTYIYMYMRAACVCVYLYLYDHKYMWVHMYLYTAQYVPMRGEESASPAVCEKRSTRPTLLEELLRT